MSRLCQRCHRPFSTAVQSRGTYNTVGSIGGSLATSSVGSAAGRGLGSVVGPVGSFIGSVAGAIGGAIVGGRAGAAASNSICDAVEANADHVCKECKAGGSSSHSATRSSNSSSSLVGNFVPFSGSGQRLGSEQTIGSRPADRRNDTYGTEQSLRSRAVANAGPQSADLSQIQDDEALARQLQEQFDQEQ